jgi:putative endonuclease
MSKAYCVYILANRSRNLYTGVTNDLERRMIEHRDVLVPGFTTHYRIFRLVHFETFAEITPAIAREKEIKRLAPREKKPPHRTREPYMVGPSRNAPHNLQPFRSAFRKQTTNRTQTQSRSLTPLAKPANGDSG